MEQECFARHGQLGRTEFQLPVMAENHVEQLEPQLVREPRNPGNGLVRHVGGEVNVADEPAHGGHVDEAVEGVFIDLPDIVQQGSCHKKVPVYAQVLVERENALDKPENGQGVLQQAADIVVMNPLCRRRFVKCLFDSLAGKDLIDETP